MKDRPFSEWVNKWPLNPTQNMYRRAIKVPHTGLESQFSKRYDEFKKAMKMDNPFDKEYGHD